MRQAQLSASPAPACVRHVLSTTPAIAKVVYAPHDGSVPPREANYVFAGVPGSNIDAYISVQLDQDDHVLFSEHLMPKNSYVDRQPDADATRPVMSCVENRLEHECGLAGLAASLKETCRLLDCPSVAPSCAPRRVGLP